MTSTVGDLFDISYGQSEYETKSDLEPGNTILISSKGDDNGCYGFFNIPAFYKAPFITVPRTGTIGQAFVQDYDCCANSDCLILIPKSEMSMTELYQVAYQIRKNKWKYQYGRKITPTRLSTQVIKLEKSDINYKEMVKSLTPAPSVQVKHLNSPRLEWRKLTDFCEIEKRTALPQNQMERDGSTPYVTTSSRNNGVSEFVTQEPNAPAHTLTVALNGSCGETFYQFTDYVTSGDNAVLALHDDFKTNPYLLMFIGFMIERQQWKYNYYRKLNLTKLKKMQIPMPINQSGSVDTEYIANTIKNSYGYETLKPNIENALVATAS